MNLDFAALYTLGEGWRRTALRAHQAAGRPDPDDLLLARVRPTAPVVFRRDTGSRPMDLVGTTSVATTLVSDRFVAVLADVGADGWTTYPVRVLDRAGAVIAGYHGLAVTGRAGPLDRGRTRVVARPPQAPAGGVTYEERGWYFDPATWDGTDVFAAEGTRAVCVTDRVRRALEGAGATNVAFTRLSHRLVTLHAAPPVGRALAPD